MIGWVLRTFKMRDYNKLGTENLKLAKIMIGWVLSKCGKMLIGWVLKTYKTREA